jgi:hypothetical protein
MARERSSAVHNKESRTGSLTSDLSVKAFLSSSHDDDQLIAALVKRLSSKASPQHKDGLNG